MWVVLLLLAGLALVGALSFTVLAGGAAALASALWVCAAVLFAGAVISEAINARAAEILRRLPPAPGAEKAGGPYSDELTM